MARIRTVIGLMSGTSMDGVDVALVDTDGTTVSRFGPFRTYAFSEADRDIVRAAVTEARTVSARDERPAAMARAEAMITDRHAVAVERFLSDFQVEREAVEAVGFHGQTVFHDPARGLTIQLGDGAALADRLGMTVVWDLRADDMAAGGQGAPLAPVFHRALAETAGFSGPTAFINIGGVANITWIGSDGTLIAFDCGPGNALIDDWIQEKAGKAYDPDGSIARTGAPPDRALLEDLLGDGYFSAPPPKSLDRDHFAIPALAGMSAADGCSLLTHFSVQAIASSADLLPEPPVKWIATGGGRHNGYMMELLGKALGGRLVMAEQCGFDGDAIEAQAFAYLAVRALGRMPISYPGTTGVSKPLTGGIVSPPERKP
jgi:anhydro-N-acetylmuramic acid kinase